MLLKGRDIANARLIELAILTLLGSGIYGYYFFSYEFLYDHDLYFHLKVSEILSQKGHVWSLPWMANSIHSERYVDYHFLYHWLHVPAILIFDDLIFSAKITGLAFLFFSITCYLLLLGELKIQDRWFWTVLLLFGSAYFSSRLIFLRGSVLFTGIIFLFFVLTLQRKFRWLFFLSWFAVWTYPGFPILGIFAFFYWIANAFRKKFENKFLMATAGGLIAGFVIHPAFPDQFYGYWLEMVIHSLRPEGLERIQEWAPIAESLLKHALLMPIGLFMFSILFETEKGSFHRTLEILSVFLLFSLFSASKPIEFFIPIVSVFLAIALGDIQPQIIKRLFQTTVLIAISFWSFPQFHKTALKTQTVANPVDIFEAADWLKVHTPSGTKVLIPWDKFNILFYRNDANVYTNGMNPVYSYGQDPFRYARIMSFYKGRAMDVPYIPIEQGFEYVLLDKDFLSTTPLRMNKASWAKNVFENKRMIIYKMPKKISERLP